MKRSANEITTLVLKAGRGAGLPLGVAEDLGFAADFMDDAGLADLAEALSTEVGRAALLQISTDLDAQFCGAPGETVSALPAVSRALAALHGLGADDLPLGAREVPDALWNRLDRLAQKTYVPASATSRERGAGAMVDDND